MQFVVLKNYSHKARQSAPTDGRDANGAIVAASKIALTSKQNSDANGMFYQWGRKDPFTFATSSQQWGSDIQKGKYPVKIYTIDGVLIYQIDNGGDNTDKQPVGGVIGSSAVASSMMETIKNPVAFYSSPVIVQTSQTKELWDYYWTSYSRGTDGTNFNKKWHNTYLAGYTAQRLKSIYDPCPYGFRVPTNGVCNNFVPNFRWVINSYNGGIIWNNTWFTQTGRKASGLVDLYEVGQKLYIQMALLSSNTLNYCFSSSDQSLYINTNVFGIPNGMAVRCIEISKL